MVQVQQEELARLAAEHAQKQAEQRLAEAESAASQVERDENAVQWRLADQASSIMGLQHSLQNAQADLQKFHAAHARCVTHIRLQFVPLWGPASRDPWLPAWCMTSSTSEHASLSGSPHQEDRRAWQKTWELQDVSSGSIVAFR